MRECDRQGRSLHNQPVSSLQGEQSGNVKIGQGVRGYFRTKHSSELNLSCFISLDGVNNAGKYGFFWFVFNILCVLSHRQENIEINNSKCKIDDK